MRHYKRGLVLDALNMAVIAGRPDDGVVARSHHDTQYTTPAYRLRQAIRHRPLNSNSITMYERACTVDPLASGSHR
ncbi:MAG: hypothetical protein QOK35_3501 [Pseudonocardiales bacterium]|nr:hypothetical protein [Pseudonocardiales bacterium]